jgi:hypothetical protein
MYLFYLWATLNDSKVIGSLPRIIMSSEAFLSLLDRGTSNRARKSCSGRSSDSLGFFSTNYKFFLLCSCCFLLYYTVLSNFLSTDIWDITKSSDVQ